MMDFSGQHIPYDGELFVFLSGEQMSIPHRHGDILVAHEFLQLHERDLAGLRQPGGKSMPHGMQGDCVQAVTVFRSQSELSDGGLEAGGRFLKRHLFGGAAGRWVPLACACTPEASGSYLPVHGRRHVFPLSE